MMRKRRSGFGKLRNRGTRADRTISGVLYENGKGVPRNYAEALKYYRLAAEQGHAVAQNNLGVMYATAGECRRI